MCASYLDSYRHTQEDYHIVGLLFILVTIFFCKPNSLLSVILLVVLQVLTLTLYYVILLGWSIGTEGAIHPLIFLIVAVVMCSPTLYLYQKCSSLILPGSRELSDETSEEEKI